MGLFSSLVGGVLGVGGSIFGGISASKAANKAKKSIENQKRENDNWYNRNYNADTTQLASAQRILTINDEAIRNRNRAAAGAAAVAGGTEESVAATKAANAQAMADATSQIAVAGERRKDNIEDRYMERRDNIDRQLIQTEVNKANAIGEATKGVADAAGGLLDLI